MSDILRKTGTAPALAVDEVDTVSEFVEVLQEVQTAINESLGFSMDMQTVFDVRIGWAETSTNDWEVIIAILRNFFDFASKNPELDMQSWNDVEIFVSGVNFR